MFFDSNLKETIMLRSLPIMSQSRWENSFCREHDDQQVNCLELALRPAAMETYPLGSGVVNSEGSDGYEATSEVKMILGSVHDHGCSPRSSAASLSAGNGLVVDHKDDNLYVANHVELEGLRLNSESEKEAAGIDHQTDLSNYASLASEDEMIGTWSPREARKDETLIINRSGAHFQSSDAGVGEPSARLDLVENFLSRGGFPVAKREISWIRSASKSRRTLFNNEENLQEWPKSGSNVSSSAKDSTGETPLDRGVGGSRNNAPRVCVDCKTTKTPLWRSGPQGPKSLCNACGIRYRKARRALSAFGNSDHIAAAAACNSTSPKRKLADNREERAEKFNLHFKKRSRLAIPSLKKFAPSPIHLETSSSHSAIQRVFAQDEEEAAVLLMALSCGFVHV